MSVFVSAFSPIHLLPVTYPVTQTQISAREVGSDGSVEPSRELKVDSAIYDNHGRVVMNQSYTIEVWA